jgi:uncharacterized membrane protein YagU involved in acid resistance
LMLHYLHPKMPFLAMKMNSLTILEFKIFTIISCYIMYIHWRKFSLWEQQKRQYLHQNEKSRIGKVMGRAIFSYITTKNHCVLCNMWNTMQYEIFCLLTLNYCILIIWNYMVLPIHKESKSINKFIRFYNELGEFIANLSIA